MGTVLMSSGLRKREVLFLWTHVVLLLSNLEIKLVGILHPPPLKGMIHRVIDLISLSHNKGECMLKPSPEHML